MNIDNIKSIQGLSDFFAVNWNIHTVCNFECSYCLQRKHRNKTLIDFDRMHKIGERINNLINNTKRITYIEIIGGEPSLINLKEHVFKYLTSKYIYKIQITTNLSSTREYYLDINNYLKERNIQLLLKSSLHDTQVNPIEHLEKAKYLCENNCLTEVSIVGTKDNLDTVELVKNYCNNNDIRYILRCEKNGNDNSVVNMLKDKQFDNSKHKGDKLIEFNDGSIELCTFYGMKQRLGTVLEISQDNKDIWCTAGTTSVKINEKGDLIVNACSNKQNKVTCNILEEDFNPNTYGPHKCIGPANCGLNHNVSIFKNKYDCEIACKRIIERGLIYE